MHTPASADAAPAADAASDCPIQQPTDPVAELRAEAGAPESPAARPESSDHAIPDWYAADRMPPSAPHPKLLRHRDDHPPPRPAASLHPPATINHNAAPAGHSPPHNPPPADPSRVDSHETRPTQTAPPPHADHQPATPNTADTLRRPEPLRQNSSAPATAIQSSHPVRPTSSPPACVESAADTAGHPPAHPRLQPPTAPHQEPMTTETAPAALPADARSVATLPFHQALSPPQTENAAIPAPPSAADERTPVHCSAAAVIPQTTAADASPPPPSADVATLAAQSPLSAAAPPTALPRHQPTQQYPAVATVTHSANPSAHRRTARPHLKATAPCVPPATHDPPADQPAADTLPYAAST